MPIYGILGFNERQRYCIKIMKLMSLKSFIKLVWSLTPIFLRHLKNFTAFRHQSFWKSQIRPNN